MKDRVDRLAREGHPTARPLTEVIEQLGHLYENIPAHAEPKPASRLPQRLIEGLRRSLGLTESELEDLTEAEAQRLLSEHWSHQQD